MSEGHVRTIPPKVEVHEDEALCFSGRWSWLATDVDSASLKVYKGAEDKTSTMAPGSASFSGKTVKYPEISSWEGGEDYRIFFKATDKASEDHVRMLEVHVVSEKTGC